MLPATYRGFSGEENVVGLRYALGAECVGLNDIGTCAQVAAVDVEDNNRARQTQHVVVALHLHLLQATKSFAQVVAPEVGFRQAVRLHHRTHSAVQNQDTLTYNVL